MTRDATDRFAKTLIKEDGRNVKPTKADARVSDSHLSEMKGDVLCLRVENAKTIQSAVSSGIRIFGYRSLTPTALKFSSLSVSKLKNNRLGAGVSSSGVDGSNPRPSPTPFSASTLDDW